PSAKWHSQVKRLVYEYKASASTAIGESSKQSGLSCAAATTSSPNAAIAMIKVARTLSRPAGIGRMAVRGLAASKRASIARLNDIAAVRAPTIASVIH